VGGAILPLNYCRILVGLLNHSTNSA
jgi:hypothetical protein